MAPQALEATNTAQAEPNWSISEQNQNFLATQCWEAAEVSCLSRLPAGKIQFYSWKQMRIKVGIDDKW